MIKLLIIVLLLVIVGTLFSGLYFLYRDTGADRRMAQALTWRIGLAIGLFLVLLAAFRFGLIPGYNQ